MIKSSSKYNLHPLMKSAKGNKILDYRLRTRLDENYIPQYFNNRLVFQSFPSFQQNNLYLSKQIRAYVQEKITTTSINAIGGESYLYDTSKKGVFYSNSLSIINDAKYNGYSNSFLVNYNTHNIKITNLDTVINLAKLNTKVLQQVNNSNSNKIIIINCHHQDFWKKSKLFTNFKLFSRKQFIDFTSRYFITVSIFLRKKAFVPLGGNCSVCYYLKTKGIRTVAYPFDWCQIKLGQINEVLSNAFKDYTKVGIKKFSELHENSYIISNKYCRFAHEVFKEEGLYLFQEKLERRIKRFKMLKNPIFIRNETFIYKDTKIYIKYWKKIIKSLDIIFNKQYKIILISSINPKIEQIKWIKYNSKVKGWKKDDLPWDEAIIM